ncbi:hypothetical protein EDD16DRAFT_1538806 [Pisolithus croceorrhizus]|nr:hypothetical protein EDD16DRAFT_1538806 [Pisolithus croceorrhizus]
MQGHRLHGSPFLTQQIAGCYSKVNEHLLEFTALSQMQLLTKVDHLAALVQSHIVDNQSIRQFIMTLEMGQSPVGIALGYVILVSATGREHKMLSDQCASFQQLRDMLPVLLHQCWPDEAELQQWYIDRGQYDFVLDDGTIVTELTSGSDLWSRMQAGTKIVMRVITEEIATSFSERYQCPCGTWNDLKTNTENILVTLKRGRCITCCWCKRRFLVTRSEREKMKNSISKQKKGPPSDDDERVVKAKYLIRNFVAKQVLQETRPMLDAYERCPNYSPPFSCNLYGQTFMALYGLKFHWRSHHANIDIPAAFQRVTRSYFITATANVMKRARKTY